MKTAAEVTKEEEKIKQIVSAQFQLKETRNLSGTMNLDNFTANLYTRNL